MEKKSAGVDLSICRGGKRRNSGRTPPDKETFLSIKPGRGGKINMSGRLDTRQDI